MAYLVRVISLRDFLGRVWLESGSVYCLVCGRENPAVPTSEYSLNSPNQLAPFQISNGVSSVSHSFSTLPPSAPAILCSAHTLPTCSEPDPDGQTRRPPWKRGWLGGNEPKIRLAQVALVKAVSGNESSCDSKHAA